MKNKKILIIGAGEAGQDVVSEIKKNPQFGIKIVGFLDDDPSKLGKTYEGILVLGKSSSIKKFVKKYLIDEIIIAIPSAEGESIAQVVKFCADAKVLFRIVPRVKEIIEGKAQVSTLRKVEVSDLLGRPVIKSDVLELKTFFSKKTVLITGAAGSIGSELSRQIAAYSPKNLVLIDWWENGIFYLQQELDKDYPKVNIKYIVANIRDKEKLSRIFKKFKANFVYHAAAYKHVPLMEENADEAVKNNIFATFVLSKLAIKNNVEKFVIVSTDKAANPRNVMGATKMVTEGIGKFFNGTTKFMAVRFGNVLESNGSVVPTFKKQIEEGGPVTVTDKKMTRFFMTIPEAVQLILKAASLGNGGELFVLDMGKPVKILDLANNLIRLSGKIPDKDIKIVFTGKRKGEKLFEKLFTSKEKLKATKEGKIFVTQTLGFNIENLIKIIDRLQTLVKQGDNEKIKAALLKISKK